MSSRRDAAPITDSMRASLSASMPTWRGTNSPAFSSSASGFKADMSIAVPGEFTRTSGFLDERVVRRLVHQCGDLAPVAEADLEEPAGGERVAVGERRIGAQGFVDLDHLAAHRHVEVGRGLDRFDDASDIALPERRADRREIDED